MFFEVKNSLAGFDRGKKSMSLCHQGAIARESTRIGFQEALIRFSKFGFPIAHGMFLSLQYKDYINS